MYKIRQPTINSMCFAFLSDYCRAEGRSFGGVFFRDAIQFLYSDVLMDDVSYPPSLTIPVHQHDVLCYAFVNL